MVVQSVDMAKMVGKCIDRIRQKVNGDMDGSYMVLLLPVPAASVFSKISYFDNGGGIFDKLSDCNSYNVGYR